MRSAGNTPIEVATVLQLRDYDVAVCCLEVVRSYLPSILPEDFRFRVEVIPLCHHHPSNCYPAFGIIGAESWEQVEETQAE